MNPLDRFCAYFAVPVAFACAIGTDRDPQHAPYWMLGAALATLLTFIVVLRTPKP